MVYWKLIAMAGGGFTTSGGEFEAKITPIVILSCMMAATGGLMFGYDIGVSGGVTSMPAFLKEFFPEVYRKTVEEEELDSNYCKYDNEKLQLFTSCLYLAGLMATFLASHITRRQGRRATMLISGFIFIAGVAFNAAAQNLAMLIIGRVLLGSGVGFANQAVPVFLSEIAPSRIRGALNILFQLNITLGILFSNLVNYATNKEEVVGGVPMTGREGGKGEFEPIIGRTGGEGANFLFTIVEAINLDEGVVKCLGSIRKRERIKGGWGWRLSLGLGGLPALLLTLGAFLVVDTPNSLIERGHLEEGKSVLRKIRGIDNVEPEFLELLDASRVAKEVKHPFRNILKRKNRPQLVISIALQFTGINAIMFYAPVLFNTLGFKNDASLYSAVITGAVNVVSTVVSIYSVDRLGRKMLLLEAGAQMFLSQLVIAVIIGMKVKDHSEDLSKGFAVLVVVLVCIFVSAFAWSWGPLSWLIPSEIFPLETRSAGQSIAVCVNLLCTFVIAQAFLSMLCFFKFGIFLFFSGCVLIMSTFVLLLLPETKNDYGWRRLHLSCIMPATGGLMFEYDVGVSMFIAGFIFIAGVAFCAAAQNLAMLIFGGASFPFRDRTIKNTLSMFQLNITLGILLANLVNYATNKIKGGWGWRLSLGLGGLPALLLTLGAFLVVDTPNSLIERGHLEEGKSVLRKIRGIDNIEPEFLELLDASRVAKEVKHPFRNILKRRNRSQLVISIALQVFQQFTGINVISLIMFYAPILFNTLGFKNDASLYSAVITGAINVLSTVVSIYSVDRVEQ
ncbi:Sugar transport protein 13 [Glycine soja]